MAFKNVMLGTIAASGIILATSIFTPAGILIASSAMAQSSVSVDINIGAFYDRLEPYGSWVSFHDRFVFVPQDVDADWRPYTRGHWAYTRRYGWLWISDERFGWATYHYGRWGYSRDIGWYWVPGRRWAPAWVAWSRDDSDVAWAPLPPQEDDDLNVNITIGDVPDYYWQAVPVSAFVSVNLFDSVIRDRSQVRTIVQQSPPQTVNIQNNIVINNIIQVNDIEKATNTKVKVLDEKPVNSPDAAGKADANSVAIFNPTVAPATDAKPKNPKKVDDVVVERKAKGIEPADVPPNQPAAPVSPTLGNNSKPAASAPAPAQPTLDANGKPIAPAPTPPATDANGKPKVTTPTAPATNAKPIAPTTPNFNEKPIEPTAPNTSAKPIAPTTPNTNAKPIAPPAVTPTVETKPTPAPPKPEKKTLEAPMPVDQNKAIEKPPINPAPKAAVPPPPPVSPKPPVAEPMPKPNLEKTVPTPPPPAAKAPAAPAAPPPVAKPPAGNAPPKQAEPPADKTKKGDVACDPAKEACPPAK